MTQQEVETMLQSLLAIVAIQGQRIYRLEHEAKTVNASLSTVALHLQALVREADARMREHVAAAVGDMAGAMSAIDAALKAIIEAAHVRLKESQRDAQALKAAVDLAHAELLGVQGKVQTLQVKAVEAKRVL